MFTFYGLYIASYMVRDNFEHHCMLGTVQYGKNYWYNDKHLFSFQYYGYS